jgi:small subunit ribosomal protein S24e
LYPSRIGIKMKVEVVDKVENPLFKRTEVKFRVDHAGAPTPKRLEVRPQLAALLGVAEDLLVIDKLASTHGRQVASGIARTYSSREQLDKTEPKYLLKRGLPKEAKPEKPAEEKPKETKPEKPKPEKMSPKETEVEEKSKEKK